MASFNRVILMGNLTRDPEVRQAQSGTYIAKAGIAVNDRVPDGQGGWTEKANFFDITFFGRRAENFAKFFKKGSPVLIEGRLEYQTWQDRESGQNRSKVEVVGDNWSFVGGGREEGGNGGGGGGNYGGDRPQQSQQQQGGNSPGFPDRKEFSAGGSAGGGGGFPDDVPF